MNNFTYYNRTKMIFGKDTELQLGSITRQYGNKVLLHYGSGSIKQFGLYNRIIRQLQASNIDYVELGGVIPNPSLELVYKGIDLCRNEAIDFILAVGGGSVIDSAKAIAAGVLYDGDVWDFFVNGVEPKKALDIGVVLTIPAAGSESSIATVVTNYEAGLKRVFRNEVVRPVFAIMNPEITYTLPPYQTACGAIDMMAHIIERYFTNTEHVELTTALCEASMKTIVEQTAVVMEHPQDYGARSQLMLAGAIAHNGSLGMGREEDWACHAMEYEVTQLSGVAHGAGLAILIPSWMRFVYTHDAKQFANFARNVFGVEEILPIEELALLGIRKLEEFYHSLGISTHLKDVGISEEDVEQMANLVTKNDTIRVGHFVSLSKDDVLTIYKNAL
jgi:alcohol dehydrogenase YqhD (iron-dependent ADH family)